MYILHNRATVSFSCYKEKRNVIQPNLSDRVWTHSSISLNSKIYMIRKANTSDCINLAALSLEVWLRTYCVDGIRSENSKFAVSAFTEESFKKILADSSRRVLLFTEDMYLRGYVLLNLRSHYQSEEHGFEIERLYVQEAFQSLGIGQKLLQEVKARYGKNFWLYTWERNNSLQFYKSFGFKDIGQYGFKLGNDIITNRVLTYNESE